MKVRGGVFDLSGQFGRPQASAPPWTDVLDAIVDHLRDCGQLLAVRPETINDFRFTNAEYVFEFVQATRVLLPVDDQLVSNGYPPMLSIWVADPPQRVDEPENDWDLFGAYLFLIEEGDPAEPSSHRFFFSGVSALAKIVQAAQPSLGRDERHMLGRGDGRHPLEKLADLGADTSLEREIETLYQMRYMTDEQGGWSVSDGRVNDLLGYPLAILSSGGP